jgi:hypothetical protein
VHANEEQHDADVDEREMAEQVNRLDVSVRGDCILYRIIWIYVDVCA